MPGPYYPPPVFPSRWYHAVNASQVFATQAAVDAAGPGWEPTPQRADMHRTMNDALQCQANDVSLSNYTIYGSAPPAGTANVNRVSATWQARASGYI